MNENRKNVYKNIFFARFVHLADKIKCICSKLQNKTKKNLNLLFLEHLLNSNKTCGM